MAESITSDPQPSLNIYQKIHAIASELKPLEKDGQVKERGKETPLYCYISHDAVTIAVREPMLRHGVTVIPSVLECKNDGNRTEMRISVDFVNVENPNDRVTTFAFGYGVDSSDKGPGKAYSYAMKYAYLKTFMLNTGEDIEEHDEKHDPAVARGSQIEKAQQQTREAIATAAKNLKAAIDGATTVKELLAIQRENKDWLMEIPDATRDYFIDHIQTRKTQLEGKAE